MTFAEACTHITNFTSAHESLSHTIGTDRLAYPPQHIEIDNRLSWFLGRLDQQYGDDAVYVHLTRDAAQVAQSFLKRWDSGIISAYRREIIMGEHSNATPYDTCVDYIHTVNSNIAFFLKDKPHALSVALESFEHDFLDFWNHIGATGDINSALKELRTPHNASA